MKFSYQFSNLCGSVYKGGNLVFTPDGTSVLSPVGNRITVFDLTGHKSTTLPFENRKNISLIALSPDGRLLISVDEDGRALLVNFPRRIVLHHFNFKVRVHALEFSPDGRLFAASHGSKVQLWRTPGLRREFSPFVLFRTFTGFGDDVTSLSWSGDSRFLLAGSRDMTCKVFAIDPQPGFIPHTLAGHRDAIVAAFFADDAHTVYSVARDGAIYAWAWRAHGKARAKHWRRKWRRLGESGAGKIQRTLAHREAGAAAAAESSDEEEEEEVDGEAGDGEKKGRNAEPWAMAITQGRWHLAKKHLVVEQRATIQTATFHRESSLLVLGLSSGVFALHAMPDCDAVHTLSVSQRAITAAAIGPGGDWLALGSSALGQLLVWEWATETYVLKQQGHFYDMNTLAFSPDGQRVATGGDDGKLKVWSASSGFCFVTFSDHSGPVTGVEFIGSGHALVTSSLDGTVRAFDLLRYKNFRTMTTPVPVQFRCLAVDPAGEVVCAGAMDPFEIYVWTLKTGRLLEVLSGHEGPLSALAFNGAKGTLASASWDRTVRLWNVYGGSTKATEELAHKTDVLALAIRPDGEQLATATLDGHISLWDVESGRQVGSIDGRRDIRGGRSETDKITARKNAKSRYFTSLCYTADGSCILAGGNSRFVCIYEVSARLLVKRFQVSHNRSLAGVVDELNSRNMTEAGPAALIDARSDEEDEQERRTVTLPGVQRGDKSSRRVAPELRTKCVRFSPTGRAWAAAATEGLLIYSLDDFVVFDPFDLDESVTPTEARRASAAGQHTKAVLMAVHLNDAALLRTVFERVPADAVPAAAASMPTVYLPRILSFLAVRCGESPHLETNLRWLLSLLQAHGDYLRERGSEHMPTLRAVHRALATHLGDLADKCHSNQYALSFLAATASTHGPRGSLSRVRTALAAPPGDDSGRAATTSQGGKIVAGDAEAAPQVSDAADVDSEEEAAFVEWAATTDAAW